VARIEQQHINVTQIQKNEGCLSGCGTLFAVAVVLGLAIQYWYISAAVAVLAIGFAVYWFGFRERPALETAGHAAVGPAPSEAVRPSGNRCENCGATGVTSLFCPECGAAQTLTCSGCGKKGLSSTFCPECGSATFRHPAPEG
jgi:ribosomal protein L32